MSQKETSPIRALLAGGAAGTSVDVALFPLDTVKTRLQSEAGFLASGGFRGIYNGLAPVVLASAPSAAAFFCAYETTKNVLGSRVPTDYQPLVHITAASAGEVTACVVRVPMEVVKQRRQVQQFNSSLQVVQDILRNERFRGFFRGYFSTVARDLPFSVIQFPVWEVLKKLWSENQGYYVDSWQSSLCGALSGGFAATITTPLDVAKTRIMLAHHSSTLARGNITNALQAIYKHQGVTGLFSGVLVRAASISLGGAIFFGIYEKVLSLLNM
ncbi:hypothetical protein Pmani_028035 [Petrolisthes manimaculis]|uniref:S-adenosylmethionine mitochondrial carrier protein n=1 Tax=Petrolisthes manimaculis TaxID=1843537 RepID=A0AAE1P1T6_9EUCA|nr:hypothetical protein Pmani_028035 [Petrolisthes manimaculis]